MTKETEILVLEARIDEQKNHNHNNFVGNKYYGDPVKLANERIAELTTQLQALKQKARVS